MNHLRQNPQISTFSISGHSSVLWQSGTKLNSNHILICSSVRETLYDPCLIILYSLLKSFFQVSLNQWAVTRRYASTCVFLSKLCSVTGLTKWILICSNHSLIIHWLEIQCTSILVMRKTTFLKFLFLLSYLAGSVRAKKPTNSWWKGAKNTWVLVSALKSNLKPFICIKKQS